MNKTRVKFIGTIVLALSVAGVLLAVGGQLNFLGNEKRLDYSKTIKTVRSAGSDTQPKYSFYNELKKRKVEIDNEEKLATSKIKTLKSTSTQKATQNYQYVIQVGAFSQQSDANKIKSKVEKLGFPAKVIKSHQKYLTQVGPFKSKEATFSVEERLKKNKLPTLVRQLK
ncbi:MAG: SPOR domain-containing protein [Ostreibacterium sp.]